MPHAVSQRQYRLMRLIAEGKINPSKVGGRGVPPKEVADKYVSETSNTKTLPDQHGENRGGTWSHKHHAKHSTKHSKKDIKKSFADFYKSNDLAARKFAGKDKAAATIVINSDGKILLGEHKGGISFPGGHMDPEDMGDFAMTALRELKEEAGIIGRNPIKVWEGNDRGTYVMVYLIESWTGTPKHGDDLGPIQWVDPKDIDWKSLRGCCRLPLKKYIEQKLGKSLKGLLALDNLEKTIPDVGPKLGESIRIVGTGLFRFLRNELRNLGDEDFRDIKMDTYTLNVRRHSNDTYSGRVTDGHKIIYQFANKTLSELSSAIMSIFEWYSPEDESDLNILSDSDIDDDVVQGGIQTLIDNYRKHNISNIYEEMESIRQQIRNGNAVDLQQIEARMMKLFDKLEENIKNNATKHNDLSQNISKEIDDIDLKLRELQSKLDNLNKLPNTVEAFSSHQINPNKVHDERYPYLTYPHIELKPNGKIKISFSKDWSDLEKQDFLHDLKAKVIKRSTKK